MYLFAFTQFLCLLIYIKIEWEKKKNKNIDWSKIEKIYYDIFDIEYNYSKSLNKVKEKSSEFIILISVFFSTQSTQSIINTALAKINLVT